MKTDCCVKRPPLTEYIFNKCCLVKYDLWQTPAVKVEVDLNKEQFVKHYTDIS